eukprot:4449041-Amphidinium_carterae.1
MNCETLVFHVQVRKLLDALALSLSSFWHTVQSSATDDFQMRSQSQTKASKFKDSGRVRERQDLNNLKQSKLGTTPVLAQ